MNMYDIIEKKRDGSRLTTSEITYFIENYTNQTIPDYQASALLMAIYFQGMNARESADLTMAMVRSGQTIDLAKIKGIKIDKHSTGGVGDTTTIILAPLVASAGVVVPKMSGRGLGHTGGTIDKLESIPNFKTEITNRRFVTQVNEKGLAIIGQSTELAPADKLLYGLRDVTATVNSIPLIASSIMSKKIAGGADKIVLDVKVGSGAFMKDVTEAKQLAELMVRIGVEIHRETIAVLSNMTEPLGYAIGNSLEIIEAIETLRGDGPTDLTDLAVELGSHMLTLANITPTKEQAVYKLRENIKSGKALEYFKRLISAQGGEQRVVDDLSLLPQATVQIPVYATECGYINEIDANGLGKISVMLGAGRKTKESVIDHAAGLVLHKKIGDYIKVNDLLCTIHTNNSAHSEIKSLVLQNFSFTKEYQSKTNLIYEVIS